MLASSSPLHHHVVLDLSFMTGPRSINFIIGYYLAYLWPRNASWFPFQSLIMVTMNRHCPCGDEHRKKFLKTTFTNKVLSHGKDNAVGRFGPGLYREGRE